MPLLVPTTTRVDGGVEKIKPGRVKKFLTFNYTEKKEEKQNQLDQIFKAAMPLLVPTTTRVDVETVKVTLPRIEFFPDGAEDMSYLMVTAPDGTKQKLQAWTELKQKMLHLFYLGVYYTTGIDCDTPTITLTMHKDRIQDITLIKDLTKADRRYEWSPK